MKKEILDKPDFDVKQHGHLSKKLRVRQRNVQTDKGVFSVENISKGEVLVVMGGVIISGEILNTLPDCYRSRTIQVEEDIYQVSLHMEEPADYINHSCEPNAGLQGQIVLVAMRDITQGEEITFDYAMSDGSSFDEFVCDCGSPFCRKQIRGDDWQSPVLWEKYEGYFSPYLQMRIEKLKNKDRA